MTFNQTPVFEQPKKKRKIWPALIGGVVFLGIVASCNGIGDGKQAETAPPAPASTTTQPVVTPKPTPSPIVDKPVDKPKPTDNQLSAEMKDAMFLAFIREGLPEAAPVSDKQLISLATDTCAAFEAGHSSKEMVTTLYNNSGESMDAGAFIAGSGIGIYCPEYLDALGEGF